MHTARPRPRGASTRRRRAGRLKAKHASQGAGAVGCTSLPGTPRQGISGLVSVGTPGPAGTPVPRSGSSAYHRNMLPGRDFEDEVRRVARELWPSSEYGGAAMEDGRERDGVFETEWITHLIECTTLRTKEKAQQDIDKLIRLRNKVGRTKPVHCWFITQEEPTADQRSVAPKDGSVNVLSFEQFRSKLVDAHGYIRDRSKYAFGSARDPQSGSTEVAEEYLPLLLHPRTGPSVSVEELVAGVVAGNRFVLLGDYGAGKSMTMREIFSQLAQSFRRSDSRRFPIHLNLRDHQAQSDPDEALERHARAIGYDKPSHLVRAWRAGYADLLLDGFDEMATPGWTGPTHRMRDLRRRSVELVRRFVRETPSHSGIVVAGREHYFDAAAEITVALGAGPPFTQYWLSELNEEQIADYLSQHGWTGGLPKWLPARPLLIAYLANRGLLNRVLNVPAGASPAFAWDSLLELVCEREAEIETAIDGNTVRRVVEELASVARSRGDGVGPIEFQDIEQAYRTVSGYTPDDRAMVLLQRLPGLGPQDPETGTRRFIDIDLADAARAGDVCRYVLDPFTTSPSEAQRWAVALGTLGLEIAALQVGRMGASPSSVVAAARRAGSFDGLEYLAGDLVRLAAELGGAFPDSAAGVFISGLLLPFLDLDLAGVDLSGLEMQDSVIERVDVPRGGLGDNQMPTFRRCHFGVVEGRRSERDLPLHRFIDCDFDEFSEGAETTAQLRATSLPLGQRVAMTVLKKLFLQRGSARKEGALVRGLDEVERAAVPSVLKVLERNGLATHAQSGRTKVWVPSRGALPRVRAMLDGPTTCDDQAWRELTAV